MRKCYEYLRTEIDLGNLGDLNSLASHGWHVVTVVKASSDGQSPRLYALLEWELIRPEDIRVTRKYYADKAST